MARRIALIRAAKTNIPAPENGRQHAVKLAQIVARTTDEAGTKGERRSPERRPFRFPATERSEDQARTEPSRRGARDGRRKLLKLAGRLTALRPFW